MDAHKRVDSAAKTIRETHWRCKFSENILVEEKLRVD
jgi:hypothetical protein